MYNFSLDYFALAAVFEGLQDAVLTHNFDGHISSCNPAVTKVLGFTPEALCSSSIETIVPPDLLKEHIDLIRKVKAGEPVVQFRTFRLSVTGNRVSVSLTISPIKDQQGNIVGVSQIIRDISKETESEVSLNRLAAIIEGSEDAIISKTLNGIITSWNASAEKMFGYAADEAIGQPITILIPTDRLQEEDMILKHVSEGRKIEHFETVRQKKNGELIPISLTISPIRDSDGVIVGISKIARNISTRKLAEERQARLAAIVESSDDAIISKTLDGIIQSWNRGAEKIFGYTEVEAVGKHISLIIPQDREEEEAHILQSIRNGNSIDHYQTIRRKKSGSLVAVSLTVSPIKDAKGSIIGASKVSRDITQERAGHEALQQHAERLQILNSIAKTIAEKLDVQDILQKVTDASTRLVGARFGAFFYNVTDQQGESYMLYTLSGAPREAFDKFGMPRNTQVFHATFSGEGVVRVDDITQDPRYGKMAPHFGMPKGHLPVTSYLAVPVLTVNGNVIGGLFFGHPEAGKFTREHEDLVVSMASHAGVALDNSMLFEQVSELSKKKDEFIALATHELKTPLTSLSGYLQLVRNRLEDDPLNQSFVEKSLHQVKKLSALVNDLFDVAKIQAGKMLFEFNEINITEIAAELVEMLQHSTAHQIKLHASVPVLLKADQLRIEQVLANFITNAIKYSPEQSEIGITIVDTDQEVFVSVKDDGIGINQENLKHIFSQFYRAKGVDRKVSGLGLGLYISKEIIERHGGRVSVESEEGKGSTFTFCLPKFPR